MEIWEPSQPGAVRKQLALRRTRSRHGGWRAGWELCAGRLGTLATAEVRPGRPLARVPAAVPTLVAGIRCAGIRSLPAGQDMGSNSQILEAALLHHSPASFFPKSKCPDCRSCGSPSSDHVTGWAHPSPPFLHTCWQSWEGPGVPGPTFHGRHSAGVPRVDLVELLPARNLQGTTEACLSSRD